MAHSKIRITAFSEKGKTRTYEDGQTPEQRWSERIILPHIDSIDSTSIEDENVHLKVRNRVNAVEFPLSDFEWIFIN